MTRNLQLNDKTPFQLLVIACSEALEAKRRIPDVLRQIQRKNAVKQPGPLYQGYALILPSDRRKIAMKALKRSRQAGTKAL